MKKLVLLFVLVSGCGREGQKEFCEYQSVNAMVQYTESARESATQSCRIRYRLSEGCVRELAKSNAIAFKKRYYRDCMGQ